MDGWARLSAQAHEATTFAQVRAAGDAYARVLGRDAARVLILGVAVLAGRAVGEIAGRVRSLPGYPKAEATWGESGGAAVLEGVEWVVREEALAEAVAAVESVVAAQPGVWVVVMKAKGSGGGGGAAPSGGAPMTVLRHRGGNRQVVLGNGQRWHVPRGKGNQDIPAKDPVGDQLQAAVTQAAKEWGPQHLSSRERRAIDKAVEEGEYWLARLLEREARGRFVESRVYKRFDRFYDWSRNKGVDVVDPATGYKYEILSGTESNMARHGRRMDGELFRLLTF